ncbi:hypothetical protein LTR56_020895 [Elasticomyces elasticus]|nr:hypothetical protein LTR56_020895 [Elasticomyces elasticus]KAK3654294.1 hypothetical protein LTR22_010770 [Elasticomyces elasticus]KAK4920227.1 hypothetical protein LTR49_012178 [Elasticomyces elasticus]KAK5749826.1 hypothetical protein LTS12_020116 [Elasticomyces elasticus]
MQVPNLDLTNLDFVAPMAEGPAGFCFNGPSQPVKRIAAAVAAQGEILRIPPPESNVSWTLEFAAPSLQCHEVEGAQRNFTWHNILDHWANVSNCATAPGYLAWTGAMNMTTPFTQTGPNGSETVFQSALVPYNVPASIYVATMPQMFNVAFVPSTAQTGEMCNFVGSNSLMYSYPIADDLCLPGIDRPACYGQEAWLVGASLTQCDLVNSTYSVAFDYAGETQTIDVVTDPSQDSSDPNPMVPRECFSSPDPTEFQGSTLTCNGTLGRCTFNTAATRLLSYQGIASAFNEQMAFVTNFNGVNQTYTYLQLDVGQPHAAGFHGVSNKLPTGQRGDLRSALEILFQNITISFLAENYLQPNYSSPYAPARLTNVTFNRYHNVYEYSTATLWVAYTVAILFTLVSLVLGMISMVLNDGSYRNDFSTILRTTRTAIVSVEVDDADTDGRQPVPRHLAKARVMLRALANKASNEGAVTADETTTKAATAETSLLSDDSRQTLPS